MVTFFRYLFKCRCSKRSKSGEVYSLKNPVEPKLRYASELWSPYTCKHKRLLGNVPRRASKFFEFSERHVLEGSVTQT